MRLMLRLEDEQKSYANLSDIIKSSLLNLMAVVLIPGWIA